MPADLEARFRVRTRFGIYEKVLKMTIPISRPGKGLEMQHKYEKVWKITLAYKLYGSAVLYQYIATTIAIL